jgi:methylmalonyl-CoA mutase cobalamin-binding domain/chain
MKKEKIVEKLKSDIVNLNMDEAVSDASQALELGISAYDLTDAMRAAAGMIGQKWESGEYFIGELVASGSVLRAITDILKPMLAPEKAKYKGRLIIGSAPEDLHDIGKNLVIAVFLGAGFEVTDLGIDVPVEKFVEAAKKEKSVAVGISALTSTTMETMGDVIKGLKAAGTRKALKVIIGGAPVTESFAKSVGADAYATDAIQGLKICTTWATV